VSNTTFQELKRRVFIGFPRTDGEAHLAVEMAINDALKAIALIKDFDDLMVTDELSAATVDGQKTYHLVDDWSLIRPKKIYTIRLMSENLSRKLIFIPTRELDRTLPYATSLSEGKSVYYTPSGDSELELIPIPDDAYALSIRYSQWPAVLSAETDVTPYANLDNATVFLAKDIANAYLSGEYFDFTARATSYLAINISEENRQPDHLRVAQPFTLSQKRRDDPWLGPEPTRLTYIE